MFKSSITHWCARRKGVKIIAIHINYTQSILNSDSRIFHYFLFILRPLPLVYQKNDTHVAECQHSFVYEREI